MVLYYGVPLGLTTKRQHKSTTLSILYVYSVAQAKYMFAFYFRNLEIQVEAFASISGDLYVHVEAFASLPPPSYAPGYYIAISDTWIYGEQVGVWAPSQYPKRRLSERSGKVLKPRDLYLEMSDRSEMLSTNFGSLC